MPIIFRYAPIPMFKMHQTFRIRLSGTSKDPTASSAGVRDRVSLKAQPALSTIEAFAETVLVRPGLE